MGTCVVTTASDVSDSNWRRKHLERAGCGERALQNCGCGLCLIESEFIFAGFFLNLCVQIVCIAAAQQRY